MQASPMTQTRGVLRQPMPPLQSPIASTQGPSSSIVAPHSARGNPIRRMSDGRPQAFGASTPSISPQIGPVETIPAVSGGNRGDVVDAATPATAVAAAIRRPALVFQPGVRSAGQSSVIIATKEAPAPSPAPLQRMRSSSAAPTAPYSGSMQLQLASVGTPNAPMQDDVAALQVLAAQMNTQIGALELQLSQRCDIIMAEVKAMKVTGTSNDDLEKPEQFQQVASDLFIHTEDRFKVVNVEMDELRAEVASGAEVKEMVTTLLKRLEVVEAEREERDSAMAALRQGLQEVRAELASNHSVALAEIGAQAGSSNEGIESLDRKVDEIRNSIAPALTGPSAASLLDELEAHRHMVQDRIETLSTSFEEIRKGLACSDAEREVLAAESKEDHQRCSSSLAQLQDLLSSSEAIHVEFKEFKQSQKDEVSSLGHRVDQVSDVSRDVEAIRAALAAFRAGFEAQKCDIEHQVKSLQSSSQDMSEKFDKHLEEMSLTLAQTVSKSDLEASQSFVVASASGAASVQTQDVIHAMEGRLSSLEDKLDNLNVNMVEDGPGFVKAERFAAVAQEVVRKSMDIEGSANTSSLDSIPVMETLKANQSHISHHSSVLIELQAGLAALEERFACKESIQGDPWRGARHGSTAELHVASGTGEAAEGEASNPVSETIIVASESCQDYRAYRAELDARLASLEARLRAQTEATMVAVQDSHAKLTSELTESKEHNTANLAQLRSSLASELSESRELQTGLQADLAGVQLSIESQARAQEFQSTGASDMSLKLSADFARSDDRLAEHASLLAGLGETVASLTTEFAEQVRSQSEGLAKSDLCISEHGKQLTEQRAQLEEQFVSLQDLSADLAALREASDSAVRDHTAAIQVRTEVAELQAAQLQQYNNDLRDAVSAAAARADALDAGLAEERRQRTTDCSDLGGRLQDGLASLEVKQTTDLKDSLACCAAESAECRQLIESLRAEQDERHRASSENHTSLISELSSKLDHGSNRHKHELAKLEDCHSLQLKRRADEIQGAIATCNDLSEQLIAERQARQLENAALSADMKVQINCLEKQSAKMLQMEVEAMQKDAAETTADMQVRLATLRQELEVASEEHDARHELALNGQRELSTELKMSLSEGIATLQGKLDDHESAFTGRIALAMGKISEQGNSFSVQLRQKESALQNALSDGIAMVGGRLDRQQVELTNGLAKTTTMMKEQQQDVLYKLSEETASLQAKMDSECHTLSKDISAAMTSIQQNREQVLDQLSKESSSLQASINKSSAETRELDLKVSRAHSELSNNLRTSIRSSEQKQEAQIRLLAEDADQRALVFAQDMETERQERDAREIEIKKEIQSCDEHVGCLRTDLVGLRSLIHHQTLEDSYRQEEADVAAARDGLLAPGLVSGAAMTAAMLL